MNITTAIGLLMVGGITAYALYSLLRPHRPMEHTDDANDTDAPTIHEVTPDVHEPHFPHDRMESATGAPLPPGYAAVVIAELGREWAERVTKERGI